jgi:hypothetical protein
LGVVVWGSTATLTGFFEGVLGKSVFRWWCFVVNLWRYAWLMWSFNSHILSFKKYATDFDYFYSLYVIGFVRLLSCFDLSIPVPSDDGLPRMRG